MSDTNPGGGSDGERGRQPHEDGSQAGNRVKRRQSPSTDSLDDNSRGQSLQRRQDFNQNQMGRLENMLRVSSLQAAIAIDTGGRYEAIPNGLNPTSGTTNDIMHQLGSTHPHAIWALYEVRPSMFTNRPENRADREQEFYSSLEPNREEKEAEHATRVARLHANIRSQNEISGDRCAICGSMMHEAKRCPAILGPGPFTERQQGFKKWCPYHLTTSHTMDQCRQKWAWLRDAKHVTEMLVDNCGAGPAFATNLIDWRCLLHTLPSNMRILLYPWTPEFAIGKKKAEPNYHDRNARDVDPATTSLTAIRLTPAHQTENGEPPQFRTFNDLRVHAEQEYQKLQAQMEEKKREIAAKDQADSERIALQIREIESMEKNLAEEKKALLQPFSSDPKLMKRINQLAKVVARADTRDPAGDTTSPPTSTTYKRET